ncbi:hypothetical protein SAMN05660900_02149 [Megasphaera cerevisiae DSM 20462]|nr:hypothetical protein SAMN05660900_02149 [Megasphaera cerevisiae DSM 20462]
MIGMRNIMTNSMMNRAQSAFEEVLAAMKQPDSQLLKREPKVKSLVVDIVRLVEKARLPESWPIETYPDNYEKIHPSDHELWVQLMMEAALQDDEFAGCLCFLRGTGCTLEHSKDYGYAIRPVIGDNGWSSQQEYDQEKQPLQKYEKSLLILLKKLSMDHLVQGKLGE